MFAALEGTTDCRIPPFYRLFGSGLQRRELCVQPLGEEEVAIGRKVNIGFRQVDGFSALSSSEFAKEFGCIDYLHIELLCDLRYLLVTPVIEQDPIEHLNLLSTWKQDKNVIDPVSVNQSDAGPKHGLEFH